MSYLIPVITSLDEPLNKIIKSVDDIIAYQKCYKIDVDTKLVADIDELYELLTAIETEPYKCVIRGTPLTGDLTARNIRRKYLNNHKGKAEIEDIDQNWMMVDYDIAMELPEGITEEEIPEYILYSAFPTWFHDTDYIFQYSAKAGLTTFTKGHYWFLLNDYISNTDLKAWAKHYEWADDSLYQPVQPHFTAAPIWEGMTSPINIRTRKYIKENKLIDVALIRAATKKQAKLKAAKLKVQMDSSVHHTPGVYYGAAKWRRFIEDMTANGAHPATKSAAVSYHNLFGSNADWAYFTLIVLNKMQMLGHPRAKLDVVIDEVHQLRNWCSSYPSLNLDMKNDLHYKIYKEKNNE